MNEAEGERVLAARHGQVLVADGGGHRVFLPAVGAGLPSPLVWG
jgi:hypothetical protein